MGSSAFTDQPAMEVTTTPTLPDDLLHLLCVELSDRLDFPTLFNCAVSSKRFANAGALSSLYRISHESPVKAGGNEALPFAEQELNVQKWSILWRTVILSSLGKTMFSYCRHLRVLDLKDLNYLLEDDKFRGKVMNNFFSGDLAKYHISMEMKLRTRKAARLNTRAIISAIGDAITEAAPMLEALTEPVIGDIFSKALLLWTPKLNKLQFLEFWNGQALADETIRNLLMVHCPNLNKISIYQWAGDDSDQHLGSFLSSMNPDTLTYFENFSSCGIGLETCLGLNSHGKALNTLKLALGDNGLPGLAVLQNCTALESLKLVDLRPPHDLANDQSEVFQGTVDWLKQCPQLREITLTNFVSAPALLAEVLSGSSIQLEKLEINTNTDNWMYVLKDNQKFHHALGEQRHLRSLLLKADPEPASRDDLEMLCDALCNLTELRELKLSRTSDYFSDQHIQLLTACLVNLEELYTSGYGISDAVLRSLSNLKNLKNVNFSGVTTFTKEGLLNFANSLGSGNQGLVFAVDAADPDRALTDAAQDAIRQAFVKNAQGRFDYMLLRDPNISEFDQSDSD